MKIQVQTSNVKLTKALQAHVDLRMGFALARFGERIGRVVLRFSDTNGHRGGADKRCQIDVALRPRSVRVEHTDVDVFVALDYAAHRASRSVAREIEREREWGKSLPTQRTTRRSKS